MKKTLISGAKPTGRIHIGNYFGMLKQCLEFQDEYNNFIFIPDYHALNGVHDAKEMEGLIVNMALDYLAVGIDPKKTTIFKQSDVSAHTELTWIFNTLVTMPFLMRAHAFKDAEAKNKEINVGTFDYPVLMAADILLYNTDIVPVGQDQKQHVEIARDIALKFNNVFGETFKLPDALIRDNVAIVPGIDGRKMSKSYNNTIPLFASDDEIQKAVMGIVTDSSGETPKNVYEIHRLFRTKDELDTLYSEHKGKYKALKEALVEDIKAFIRPLREKREKLAGDKDLVKKILKEGGEKARKVADKKLQEVKEKIGVAL